MTTEYLEQPLRSEDEAHGAEHLDTLTDMATVRAELAEFLGEAYAREHAALLWAIKIGRERLTHSAAISANSGESS